MFTAKQTKLVDELDEIHQEKHPSPSALTADRTTVSKLLAPLAPISLENADLYLELQRNLTFLSIAEEPSIRAADLATNRFRNGATGLLDLLEAQRAQLKDEDAYAESHSNSGLSAVLLYKSLAGGWPQRPPQPSKGVNP